jgi:hypothetical protein
MVSKTAIFAIFAIFDLLSIPNFSVSSTLLMVSESVVTVVIHLLGKAVVVLLLMVSASPS